MTKTIEAIYENNVLKPLEPITELQEHQRVDITFHIPANKQGLSELAGTLSHDEAGELKQIIEREFERIENEW